MADDKTPQAPPAEEKKTAAEEQAATPGKPAEKSEASEKPAPPKGWEPTGDIVSSPVTEKLSAEYSGAVSGIPNSCGEATVRVKKEKLIEILSFLKNDPATAMNYLSDLTAVHFPDNEKVFEVVYHLYSISLGHSLRLKVGLDDGEGCPTATGVWKTANWHEREVHDMFGIVFEGHPNLKTILLPEKWDGNPLRKEYPLGGPKEDKMRAGAFERPVYLPDDVEEAAKIIREMKDAE